MGERSARPRRPKLRGKRRSAPGEGGLAPKALESEKDPLTLTLSPKARETLPRVIHSVQRALGRAQNQRSYGETDLAALSATYAYGIVRNHPFADGNKRAALLSIITFLGLNDIAFAPAEAEAVVMILGLASGEIEEEGLTRWIRDNWPT